MNQKYEVVKFIDGDFELEVNVSPKEDTIWLSQGQMAILFDVDRTRITRHIKSIFEENELTMESNVRKTHLTNKYKPVFLYSLNVIISVGYRVKSKRGVVFRIWANKILKEYLLKGYVINENRVVVSNENYIELKNQVTNINNRLLTLEDKVLEKVYKIDKIFYNGEFYDSYTLIQSIFELSNNEIIIIDNYINRTILDRLVVKKQNVKVIIYTNILTSKLLGTDIDLFNKQYKNLTVKYINKVHDRYIIIDKEKIYHLGYSFKDLGKKIFSISEVDNQIISSLLENIK